MNYLEAVKFSFRHCQRFSKKTRFKNDGWYSLDPLAMRVLHEQGYSMHFTLQEMLDEDWEIEDAYVRITLTQFWEEVGKSFLGPDEVDPSLFSRLALLATRLGFGEESTNTGTEKGTGDERQ